MGHLLSRHSPVAVSPLTHQLHSTVQSGTLVYVAIANHTQVRRHSMSMIVDNYQFFGLTVPFNAVHLENAIGSGNFGVVYKAVCRGKTVAVKRINMQDAQKTQIINFAKELDILSMLTHVNIVHFFGAVQENPHYCLIMELCAGSVVDLLRLAESKKLSITWGLSLDIALDCAQACAYLHGLDPIVLHRDLKAENLLITEHFRCKLSDFGLSRSLERNANAQTQCGTPRWLAPEVYRGEEYCEKIDVYSYGIVLWELFCFKKPYLDKDPINLAYMVAYEDLRPPLCDHIPEVLQQLMQACWDANPVRRPGFAEVIHSITSARQGLILNLPVELGKSYAKCCEAAAATTASDTQSPHHQPQSPQRAATRSLSKMYALTSGVL